MDAMYGTLLYQGFRIGTSRCKEAEDQTRLSHSYSETYNERWNGINGITITAFSRLN